MLVSFSARALGIVALVAASGCGGPAGASPGLPADVELGRGLSSFETLPPAGGELELVGGPQGGFHVFVAVRITGLEVEDLTLEYGAFDPSTGARVGRAATFVLTRARSTREGDGWVRAGDRLILDDASPDPVRGRTLDVRVRAMEAGGGAEATDERSVVIVDDVTG